MERPYDHKETNSPLYLRRRRTEEGGGLERREWGEVRGEVKGEVKGRRKEKEKRKKKDRTVKCVCVGGGADKEGE